jgi:hypothetical protein
VGGVLLFLNELLGSVLFRELKLRYRLDFRLSFLHCSDLDQRLGDSASPECLQSIDNLGLQVHCRCDREVQVEHNSLRDRSLLTSEEEIVVLQLDILRH